MTVTDVSGRPLGPSGVSTIEVGGEADASPRPRTRQAVGLVAAFLVGFGSSQVLSDERQSALRRSSGGQLSLELTRSAGPDYVTDSEGRLAVALSLDVRNTGPVDVVLQSAEIGDLSDPGVEGRALLAEGVTRISLTRPVDCEQSMSEPALVGPLVVRARTPAGSGVTRLPLTDEPGERFSQRLREACGDVPPEDALDLRTTALQFEDDRLARLPLALRNASARALLVTEVRPVEGLSVGLLDADGASVALPLRLPAADFSAPRPPDAGQQRRRLTAVLSLASCTSPAGAPADAERPLLELVVQTAPGEPTTTVPYGDGQRVLRRLREAGCPGSHHGG